jgi:hypothetical protein
MCFSQNLARLNSLNLFFSSPTRALYSEICYLVPSGIEPDQISARFVAPGLKEENQNRHNRNKTLVYFVILQLQRPLAFNLWFHRLAGLSSARTISFRRLWAPGPSCACRLEVSPRKGLRAHYSSSGKYAVCLLHLL